MITVASNHGRINLVVSIFPDSNHFISEEYLKRVVFHNTKNSISALWLDYLNGKTKKLNQGTKQRMSYKIKILRHNE